MFAKILVANRGEIALRVMRTCREMGISTVGIYSDIDSNALHASYADESYRVGENPSRKSYLNADRIIEIAKETGSEAVHPGYGFLAENADFARKCETNEIVFIGPSSGSMAKVGDKISSRRLVKKAGIQITAGSEGAVDEHNAMEIARDIGYPVILKSSAGGGGISMGVVEEPTSLINKLEIARSSSLSSFGDPNIFMEKYLLRPRHIEFQILADKSGNVIHLGERECSIQRRFQKLIEEAPSVVVDEETRAEIGERAVEIARLAGYVNAGTMEFLYQDGEFFFNEVNARLQVEHPITELVTGVDLVKEQIRIAAGAELAVSQSDIKFRGWAMECRINAEDPYNNFIPSPGKVTRFEPPGSIGVRVDSGIVSGSTIPTYYDSLFAKLVVHADSRASAVDRMGRALGEMRIEGIDTNIPFHLHVLNDECFKEGDFDTNFIVKREIIEGLCREGELLKNEMNRRAAAISVALAMSKEGFSNFQTFGTEKNSCDPVSKWKMAGRLERLGGRLDQ